MKKVLIITYSFPPLNNIAARRFGDLSKHLKKNGWEASILTTNSKGPLEITVPSKNIFRIGTHPQKSSEIKGSSSNGNSFKSMFMNWKREAGFNARLIDRTYINWFNLIRKMDIDLLKEQKFDVIIASFGPGSSLFAGDYLSQKLKIPWIADFRDLGALYQDHEFKKNFLFRSLDLAIEKKLLSKATAVTTVSKGLKDELSLYYDLPVHVIYNGWEKIVGNKTGEIIEEPYIYYAGRFYEHQIKSIYMLIDSLEFTEHNLKIRTLGPESLNIKIYNYAKNNGVSDKVELLPPVSPEIVDEESELAALNLVVEDLDKSFDWKKGTLTGKFLSLLIKSPPILTIAREDSEIGEILKETGKGQLCTNKNEVVKFLINSELFKKNTINEKKIKGYSKEKQAELLSSILDRAITEKD